MATATRIVQTTLTLTTTCRMVASRSGRRWDSSTATQHLKFIRTVGRDVLSHSIRAQRLHGNNDDSDCDKKISLATLQQTAVKLNMRNGGGGQSTPKKASIVALATVSCKGRRCYNLSCQLLQRAKITVPGSRPTVITSRVSSHPFEFWLKGKSI